MLLTPGARPVWADGKDKPRPPAQGGDAFQFQEELRRGGAIKFYEDTEDILRAGKFERAYLRYLFLLAHIRGQPLDAGLIPIVDQRLQFLRAQMQLGEGFHYAGGEDRPVRRKPPAKPACPPPPPKEEKKGDAEEKPPEMVIPPAPSDDKATPSPKEEAKPPAEEAPKPVPALSTWEKFKGKLRFWRKDVG